MLTRRALLYTAACASAGVAQESSVRRPARLKTAICAYSFRKDLENKSMSYEDLVRLAVDLDVDGLDMTVYWFPSTDDAFLLPLRRLAYRSAVEIYSISVRTDLCRPPGEARDKQATDLRKWVDVAQKLGASHIRVFGGNVPKGSTEDDAASWVVEMLKPGAEYAGSRGVILGLENHGGITSRASRIVDIVRRVGSPWVGINLDTGNFDRDGYQQIEMCLPFTVNAQYKTEIRDEQGKRAASDWKRLTQMIARSGYQGYLALEYEAAAEARTSVPGLMRELGRLAKQYSG